MHKTTTVLAALAIGAAAIATSIAPGYVGTVVGIAVVAALALGGLMLASLGRAARDLENL